VALTFLHPCCLYYGRWATDNWHLYLAWRWDIKVLLYAAVTDPEIFSCGVLYIQILTMKLTL